MEVGLGGVEAGFCGWVAVGGRVFVDDAVEAVHGSLEEKRLVDADAEGVEVADGAADFNLFVGIEFFEDAGGFGFDDEVDLEEFVDGAEIDEGLAGAGFHLDAEVRVVAEVGLALGEAVGGDDRALVGGEVREAQGENVRLDVALEGIVEEIPLLAVENADNGINRLFLVGEFFEKE